MGTHRLPESPRARRSTAPLPLWFSYHRKQLVARPAPAEVVAGRGDVAVQGQVHAVEISFRMAPRLLSVVWELEIGSAEDLMRVLRLGGRRPDDVVLKRFNADRGATRAARPQRRSCCFRRNGRRRGDPPSRRPPTKNLAQAAGILSRMGRRPISLQRSSGCTRHWRQCWPSAGSSPERAAARASSSPGSMTLGGMLPSCLARNELGDLELRRALPIVVTAALVQVLHRLAVLP